MEDTLTREIRQHILTQMRQMWLNTIYQTQVELKIQAQLAATLKRDVSEAERALTDRLRDCQVALDVINAEERDT